ncbi:24700_t:CDS:1, partial [Gigaspora margarita]
VLDSYGFDKISETETLVTSLFGISVTSSFSMFCINNSILF